MVLCVSSRQMNPMVMNNQMMVRCYDGKDNLDPSMPSDFTSDIKRLGTKMFTGIAEL